VRHDIDPSSWEEYLALRRALGFKLATQGQCLLGFVGYLEQARATRITTELALAWATQPVNTTQSSWARRLGVVRRFARYLQVLDPTTEVPPGDLLPERTVRGRPHIYTDDQIAALLHEANQLQPALRAVTWQTLIGLLAVTGLRMGEARHLDRADVDLQAGALTVLDSKFGKSREVPLHGSSVEALAIYDARRDQLCRVTRSTSFFVSTRGTRLNSSQTNHVFATLVERADNRAASGQRRPRPHDVRHTFAVNTLLGWYRAGVDVQARLPLLSTYLGHVDPKATYWYLQAVPELLALAAGRLEHRLGGLP